MDSGKEIVVKKHFVVFLSPGSFFSESTQKEISSWDVKLAVKMSKDVVERYGSKPYCFYFVTYGRTEDELDSKIIEQSGFYYLGGKVETIEEVRKQGTSILLQYMEGNKCNRVVTTYTPYKHTQQLNDDDVVLNMEEFYEDSK